MPLIALSSRWAIAALATLSALLLGLALAGGGWAAPGGAPGPKGGGKGAKERVSTDTTAPNTTITDGPAAGSSTSSTSASFSFTGSDNVGVSAYECQLDGSSWSGCSSPHLTSGLAVGSHTFAVRAKDAAGNLDASPATRAWSVSTLDDPGALRVPASVPAGCSSDATAQILSWIASVPNGSTLSFDPDACYRVEGTIELRDRDLVIDGNGATFKSQNAPSPNQAMWRAWNSELTLRDMKLVGSYANGGTHDPDLQWAHGIDLRGTHGVVADVSMSDLAGDCVYFGLGAGRSSGAVRDSSCRRIGRNGVSVVAGDDIRVERTTTNQIGFTAFNVEPNTGPGNGSARVVFDSNTIGSYRVLAWAIIGHAPVTDQAFTNNRVTGGGLRIGVLFPDHRPKRLTVTGNTADSAQTPAAMEFTSVDGLTVRGNSVPMTSGTMAAVDRSCGIDVSDNDYPGGSKQVSVTNPAC